MAHYVFTQQRILITDSQRQAQSGDNASLRDPQDCGCFGSADFWHITGMGDSPIDSERLYGTLGCPQSG